MSKDWWHNACSSSIHLPRFVPYVISGDVIHVLSPPQCYPTALSFFGSCCSEHRIRLNRCMAHILTNESVLRSGSCFTEANQRMTMKPALAAHPYSLMNRFLEEPLITVDQNRVQKVNISFCASFLRLGFHLFRFQWRCAENKRKKERKKKLPHLLSSHTNWLVTAARRHQNEIPEAKRKTSSKDSYVGGRCESDEFVTVSNCVRPSYFRWDSRGYDSLQARLSAPFQPTIAVDPGAHSARPEHELSTPSVDSALTAGSAPQHALLQQRQNKGRRCGWGWGWGLPQFAFGGW